MHYEALMNLDIMQIELNEVVWTGGYSLRFFIHVIGTTIRRFVIENVEINGKIRRFVTFLAFHDLKRTLCNIR